ncbi:Uncharacterised protein [uncultured archaeon]|nr:Uncharacterised protein [uncultured archaeon]
MKLLGIDVGFAKERDTTGIAFYEDSPALGCIFGVGRATTDWATRSLLIKTKPDVVAVDAPLVGQDIGVQRFVELEFSRHPFQRRCKAGLSHSGMGLELRKAGNTTREQLIANDVARHDQIFESFPNAFLGVMVPDVFYRNMPELKRGRKFDWLYDTAVDNRLFDDLYTMLGVPLALRATIREERDHEHRAAWICLLTAWCVALGCAKPVGDVDGGFFWLPPAGLWQPWTEQENQPTFF